MLILAVRLRWILWDVSQSFVLRIAIITFTVILIYAVAQVNVVRVRLLLRHTCRAWEQGSIFKNVIEICQLLMDF